MCARPTPYLQPGQLFIAFYATGESGSMGFSHVMIPRTILNSSIYVISVDGQPVDFTELPTSNSTHSHLFFTYIHSIHEAIITIPEFSSLIMPLFVIGTLFAVITSRRRQSRLLIRT